MTRGRAFRRFQHGKKVLVSLKRRLSDLESDQSMTDRDLRQVGISAETPKVCNKGCCTKSGLNVQAMRALEAFRGDLKRYNS